MGSWLVVGMDLLVPSGDGSGEGRRGDGPSESRGGGEQHGDGRPLPPPGDGGGLSARGSGVGVSRPDPHHRRSVPHAQGGGGLPGPPLCKNSKTSKFTIIHCWLSNK